MNEPAGWDMLRNETGPAPGDDSHQPVREDH
jgi:hypothetical protein